MHKYPPTLKKNCTLKIGLHRALFNFSVGPIFVGDDVTDEDAMLALQGHGLSFKAHQIIALFMFIITRMTTSIKAKH